MIIWDGKGWLVAAIVFALLVGSEFGSEAIFADTSYYQTHMWPRAAALILAAVIVWFVATWLQRAGSRTVIDKATGQEMVLGGNDALFFIPVRFWTPILALAGVAALAWPLVVSG
jgi:hypothetical protein